MESVLFEIVRKVAEEEGVEPTELPPLQSTIAVDALEALFATPEHESVRVEFTYNEFLITVDRENQVRVEPT